MAFQDYNAARRMMERTEDDAREINELLGDAQVA
jgi:hypothetical protein